MRNRALLALVVVAAAIFVSGMVGLVVSGDRQPGAPLSVTTSPPPPDTPSPRTLSLLPETTFKDTADAYFRAWSADDFEGMRALVDQPPADFVFRHQQFENAARSTSVKFVPNRGTRTGDDTAEVTFTQVRQEEGEGAWRFGCTLHLAVRERTWKVVWTPAVMHPDLGEGGSLTRTVIRAAGASALTKEGRPFPHDSAADAYLSSLTSGAPQPSAAEGWAIMLNNPGRVAVPLIEHRPAVRPGKRTTIEWAAQAAAARALDGVGHPAALVAVRPSTGEIVAVADRLGGKGAFTRKYAPGSTFKTVTAAALLRAGLTPDTTVPCPAVYQIPNGESIPNYQHEDHGTVSLRQAFALSCNTSFARLAVERLSADLLVAETRAFGFGTSFGTGVGGTCGSMTPPANSDALAEDSFGQGTVEATPLCMALVAAAAQSGEWRPPLPLDGSGGGSAGTPLPPGVAEGLRTLMGAVTTEGTAAGAGLPDGVSGKTGTAEDWQKGADHAWFIGYRGDLAFAVFVEHGGTGRNAAVPIASWFLRAL